MRRVVVVLGSLSFSAAAALAGAVVWVDRELASAEATPGIICLSSRDQARLAAGRFGIERKDLLVSKTIEFRDKPRNTLLWHLRGATIHLVYTTFRRRQQREAAFQRVVSKIRPCRWAQEEAGFPLSRE
jgi:hypothetical protein